MNSWVTLAQVVRPQGRRGEVLAELLTDFPDQLAWRADLSLLSSDGTRVAAAVEEHWMPTGRNAGRVVLKLSGVDSINAAERLAGAEVQVPRADRLALDDSTYYVSDLIGCTVVEGGQEVGVVREMHFPHDSEGRRLQEAAPIFAVQRANGDEVLIPFANAFVRRISVDEKRIEMVLPHGLLEMNG